MKDAYPQKWWVLIAIGISTFMSALDGSVVNTVLPVITDSFSSSISSIEWVVVIYLLVLSGLLLSSGRLGDMYGNRPVFLGGFVVFIIASALCGFATSVGVLVAFRGLQALGAAALQANSPAILTKSFPARQRGQALGMQATMTYLGLTIGPSLGGWIAESWGWRWVFYINIPVGLTALAMSARYVPQEMISGKAERFDLPGAGTFLAGLVSLLLALNRGSEWGWSSAPILALFLVAGLLLTLFVLIEMRSPAPMLDLSLFQRRLFSTSVGAAILNYICVYTIIFLMPFYLIDGLGFNPARAGLVLTSMPVVMAIVAPISGSISDRFGTFLPSALGMSVLGLGLFMLSRLGSSSPFEVIAASLAVCGLGIGVFISPNNSALMGSAPRHRQGIAAGTLATSRNMGMALGVGFAGAVFTTVLAFEPGSIILGVQTAFLLSVFVSLLGLAVVGLGRLRSGEETRQDQISV